MIARAEPPGRPSAPFSKPYAFGLFLFGSSGSELRRSITELILRGDTSTGDAIHFCAFGDERHAGKHFREFVAAAGLGPPSTSWQGDEFFCSEQEEEALKKYGIAHDDLPCVAFLVPPELDRVVVFRLPRSLLRLNDGFERLHKLLLEQFSADAIERLAANSGFDRDRFQVALRSHCDHVQRLGAATDASKPPEPVSWAEVAGGRRFELRRGSLRVDLTGPSLVDLFRLVAAQPGQNHTWKSIRQAWIGRWGVPVEVKTLQTYGSRIRKALREFACFWYQDGLGVRWAPPTE